MHNRLRILTDMNFPIILARIQSTDDAMEAVVAHIEQGFSVTLRDTDANEAVGFSKIYTTQAQAMAYANTINR